jgi:YVTN family beta-propeller protein
MTSRPPPAPHLASVAKPMARGTIAVGAEPEGIAVAPDGRTLYVANQGSRILSVVDVASRAVTSVPLRNTPHFVAVSRDARLIYVSMYADDKSGSGVAVVQTTTKKVVKYIATGAQPYALAVAPDGRLWVPIHSGRNVEIYTAGDQRRVGRVLVPQNPHAVAFAADGMRAFTPNHESNSVSVIDMRSERLVRSVPVSPAPHSLAVSPDGRTVAVACYQADVVHLINAVTLRSGRPIPVGTKPQSVAFAADGAHVYVVNEGSNDLSVIDTRSGRVTATVDTGASPRSIAVAPDGRFAYVTNGDANSVTAIEVG